MEFTFSFLPHFVFSPHRYCAFHWETHGLLSPWGLLLRILQGLFALESSQKTGMLTALGVDHSFKRICLASHWANSKLGGMGDWRGDWVLQTRTAGTEAETWCLWCCWRRHGSSGRARAFCLLLGINLQGFMPFLLGTMHNILACYYTLVPRCEGSTKPLWNLMGDQSRGTHVYQNSDLLCREESQLLLSFLLGWLLCIEH